MSFGDRMAPFKAADGLAFFTGVSPYRLAAGRYGTGEGALMVVCVDGEVECKLTVSLANHGAPPLKAGELYVKLGDGDDHTAKIRQALLALGVFEVAGEPVAQGYSPRYAVAWRFARCGDLTHAAHEIDYRVECAQCRAKLARAFEAGKTRLLANESVRIIKRMGKADGWG